MESNPQGYLPREAQASLAEATVKKLGVVLGFEVRLVTRRVMLCTNGK